MNADDPDDQQRQQPHDPWPPYLDDGSIFVLAWNRVIGTPDVPFAGGVACVELDLSPGTPPPDHSMTPEEARAQVAELRASVAAVLLPELRQQWRLLAEAGIEMIIAYDPKAGVAMWVCVREAGTPTHPSIGPDDLGRLRLRVDDAPHGSPET